MTDAIRPLTVDDIRGLATIPLWPTAGELLGLSRNGTYQAAARGEIETLRFGARYRVPVAPFLTLIGAGSAQ
jgi:excisionase family DNA binding protein